MNIIKVIFLLFLIVSCKSSVQDEISFNGKKYIVNEDNELFFKDVSKVLSQPEIKYEYSKLFIKDTLDMISNRKYKYILLVDTKNNYKSAILVSENRKNKYFLESRIVSCNNNCYPILLNNKWGCDADIDTDSCEKSVSIFE